MEATKQQNNQQDTTPETHNLKPTSKKMTKQIISISILCSVAVVSVIGMILVIVFLHH